MELVKRKSVSYSCEVIGTYRVIDHFGGIRFSAVKNTGMIGWFISPLHTKPIQRAACAGGAPDGLKNVKSRATSVLANELAVKPIQNRAERKNFIGQPRQEITPPSRSLPDC